METKLKGTYEFISWIPLALWIAAHIYVSSYDGWGAWAAAPILLGPLAVSLVVGIIVTGAYLRLTPLEKRSLRAIVVLILPWIPILHVFGGNLLKNLSGI